MTVSLASRRDDLVAILNAGIAHASGRRLVARAISSSAAADSLAGRPLHVVAAGKAARPMLHGLRARADLTVASVMGVGSHTRGEVARDASWITAGHPLPDEGSLTAGRRLLHLTERLRADEQLLLLLSGGASALLAAPHPGLTLEDKRRVVRAMMHAGADIHALNTVRKHMSAIKGGRLAAACRGRMLTLAISDVVGDDLSFIASGPGVADRTTWREALSQLERWSGPGDPVEPVHALFRRGLAGELEDTPKPGALDPERIMAQVIGTVSDAIDGAREAAEARGYDVVTLEERITGEARISARAWLARAVSLVGDVSRPVCVLSGGETTVQVTGVGKGGRNQEFALALVRPLTSLRASAVAASIGTDGIDGPTDAAGAIADPTSLRRAEERGLATPERFLTDNNALAFFEPLGDLIRTGPTDTNVGDLQALLIG